MKHRLFPLKGKHGQKFVFVSVPDLWLLKQPITSRYAGHLTGNSLRQEEGNLSGGETGRGDIS